MYRPERQYKCSIIRARAISEVDNLISRYASIIECLCPCSSEDFNVGFNAKLKEYCIHNTQEGSTTQSVQKTLNNHRTEISGALFGMHIDINGTTFTSERTLKFLSDNDQPAFFKDWLFKMQFPNGMQKSPTYTRLIQDGIRLRPYPFLLRVLNDLETEGVFLEKSEIGFYILNSEDVLKGNASTREVSQRIILEKQRGIVRSLQIPPEGSSSYFQHIGDQIQYLVLANLLFIEDKKIRINQSEKKSLNAFYEAADGQLPFDAYSYDMSSPEARKKFELDWSIYFSKLSSYASNFATTSTSLGIPDSEENFSDEEDETSVDIGDEGEKYVLEFEKDRVRQFNERLVNKIVPLGKVKGLGYDIQSVVALPGPFSEFAKFIEVKTTKRVTCPPFDENTWFDSFNLTRNEWVASQQYQERYNVFRVFLTRGKVLIFVIENICQKERDNKLVVTPIIYRVDISAQGIDRVHEIRTGEENDD